LGRYGEESSFPLIFVLTRKILEFPEEDSEDEEEMEDELGDMDFEAEEAEMMAMEEQRAKISMA
jgi:hypothetical protein